MAGLTKRSVSPPKEQDAQTHLISIRASLLAAMLGLVAVIALALLIALNFTATRLVRQMSGTTISARAAQVESQLSEYFSSIENVLTVATAPIGTGQVAPLQTEEMRQFFAPFFAAMGQIAEIHACDEAGNYSSLRHKDGEWISRVARPADFPGELHSSSRRDLDAPATSEWTETLEVDPRQSHWYKGVLELADAVEPIAGAGQDTQMRIHWTEAYRFESVDDPGITASIIVNQKNGTDVVLAVDLLVASLDEFTDNLHPTPNGYVVVTDRKGQLLEPSRGDDEAEGTEEGREVTQAQREARIPIESDDSVMKAALGKWAKQHGAVWNPQDPMQMEALWQEGLPREQEIFQFQSRGQLWWGGMQTFTLGGTPEFYIAVLIPEADLRAELASQRQLVLLITMLALALAAGLAVTIATAFSAPIASLARQSDRMRRLDLSLHREDVVHSRLKEVAKLSSAHASMLSALDSFARYVPTALVRDLLDRGEAAQIGGKLLPLTILITDVRNFTAITESISPEDLARQLADYFDCVLSALHNNGATIDKLVGDSVIAFWGAPTPQADQAASAIAGILDAQRCLRELNERWRTEHKPRLVTHAAITHGKVVVGNIGAHWRLNYTAIGDAVNLASRLEKLNPVYGTELLATAPVVAAGGPEHAWRLIDRVAVRGKVVPVEIYEPLGPAALANPHQLELARDYSRAVRLVWEKRFDEADELAHLLFETYGAERSIALLMERVAYYRLHPPSWNWDGVYRGPAGGALEYGNP